MKRDDVPLVAVSAAWGLVIAVGAYAIVRATQLVASPEPTPTQLVWSVHAGYFWRALTVAYAGGMSAFVLLLVARGRVEVLARALVPAIGVTTALLALQAALFP
jgi:hypothetical protein